MKNNLIKLLLIVILGLGTSFFSISVYKTIRSSELNMASGEETKNNKYLFSDTDNQLLLFDTIPSKINLSSNEEQDKTTYINEDLGFQFDYPSDWDYCVNGSGNLVFGYVPDDLVDDYDLMQDFDGGLSDKGVCLSIFFQHVVTLYVYPENKLPKELELKSILQYKGESVLVESFSGVDNGSLDIMQKNNGYIIKTYKVNGIPGYWYSVLIFHDGNYYYFKSPLGTSSSRYMNEDFLNVINTLHFTKVR